MPIGSSSVSSINHEPRMAGLLEHLHQLAERNVLLHGDDVAARHHDVLDPAAAQRQDVLDHGALFRRDAGFAGPGGFEHNLDVGAGRAVLPAEQRAGEPGEEAFALGVGPARDRHRQVARFVRSAGRLSRAAVGVSLSAMMRFTSQRRARRRGRASPRRARILRSSRSICLGVAVVARGRSRGDAEIHGRRDGRDDGRTACLRRPLRARWSDRR